MLFVAYQDTPFPEEFLSYAMLMSNKHGYPRAYYHVYEILSGGGLYRKEIEMIDDETANLAMKYLLKAHDLKYDEANELVHEYAMQYDESTNRRQIMKRFLE